LIPEWFSEGWLADIDTYITDFAHPINVHTGPLIYNIHSLVFDAQLYSDWLELEWWLQPEAFGPRYDR